MPARPILPALLALVLTCGSAAAEWRGPVQGNDTGGIIPWSPAIAARYRLIASDHCAAFNKIAVVTSVHRIYGDYVGFRCYFPRGYDPRKGVFTATRPVQTLY